MAKKRKQQGGFVIPSFIIHFTKFLQIFSSRLTARFVRFLFQKPMNFKHPKPEEKLLNSAQIEYIYISEIKKKIAVYHWGTGDKKALMVHGWSGRATQMYRIIDALLAQGFQVYSFDGPAHGKSSGKVTMMPEFIISVEKISNKYGPFEVAIGHSLGGISTLNAQGRFRLFKKLVVIGTPDSIKDIFHGFANRLSVKPKIAERLIQTFEKFTGESIDNFHGSSNAKKIDVPVLVIHDDDDVEVSIKDALNNYKNLKKGTLIHTKSLGHNRILKDKDVVQGIVDFVNQ